MINQDKPKTHFDYFHNHKWVHSIQDKKCFTSYSIYWQIMIKKIQLVCELILSKVKDGFDSCEPSTSEIKKYNDLFKQDARQLTNGIELDDDVKKSINARIEENFQIIRCALIMKNISNIYGKERLYQIFEKSREEFTDRFLKIKKPYRNLTIKGMSADHYLTIKKQTDRFLIVLSNCPLSGTFIHLGLEDLQKSFCILCIAHGKKSMQSYIPFKVDFYPARLLSRHDSCCEFIVQIKSQLLRYLIRYIPFKI